MTARGQQVFVKFGKFSGLNEALDAFQARQIERRERCLAAGLSFEDICVKAGKPSAIGLERYEELWERIFRMESDDAC